MLAPVPWVLARFACRVRGDLRGSIVRRPIPGTGWNPPRLRTVGPNITGGCCGALNGRSLRGLCGLDLRRHVERNNHRGLTPMSVSLRYQGLPVDSGLVELVQGGKWNAYGVSQACSWLRLGAHQGGESIKPMPHRAYPYPADEGEIVWSWCCDAVGRFPDLPTRNIDVHKSYTWLPFLLSAKERKRLRWPKPSPDDPRFWDDPESDFDDLVELAFSAAPEIAPGVTGRQGIPIRFMSQNVVHDFGTCVGAIESQDAFRRVAELIQLQGHGLWQADQCMAIFEEFQMFFSEAAVRREQVLVVWE